MFMSKDFLNEGSEKAPLSSSPWGPSPTSTGISSTPFAEDQTSRPGTSYGMTNRPGSAMSRPGTSMSMGTSFGQAEDGEEQSTPVNANALRQKMLEQRKRALQKQRTVTGPSAGSMVMANESLATTEAPSRPTTAVAATRSPTGSAEFKPPLTSPTASGMENPMFEPSKTSMFEPSKTSMFEPSKTSGFGSMATTGNSTIDSAMSRISMDEKEDDGIVMPAPVWDNKEDEARRKEALAQKLDGLGVSPVFDPTPSVGGRETTFDIASLPQGELRKFIHEPAPKQAGMIECRIIRDRTGLNKLYSKYTLETDAGVFLMTAKKQKHNKTSNYCITQSKTETTKGDESYLGKLRSNFLGLEFVAYSPGMNPKKIDHNSPHAIAGARQELVAVQYSSSLWGSKPRGPRKMGVIIPRVQPSGERLQCLTLSPETEGLLALQKSGTAEHRIDAYKNKPPKWNEQIGAFVLNFNKRVTQASVKNFQLTCNEDPDTVYLQFGRVGKDVFNMDFRYPFSPFQAFAICLSSFDYKLCCE